MFLQPTFSLDGLVLPNLFGIRSDTQLQLGWRTRLCAWRMQTMTTTPDTERFRTEAAKYAAYLETPEGRLRLDLALANVQDFLPQATLPLRALDLGGGPGASAVRLARLGFHVTLLDESLPMLDFARQAAREAEVAGKIALKHGNASQLATLFPAGSFDVVLCHNVLEFVDVRNQPGEVLKAAIQNGDLASAERNLTAEWGDESLYGGRVRLFTGESLISMLLAASLALTSVRGVRVVSDYLPPKVHRNNEYPQIFELERKLGSRPEFAAIARYTQCVAHRAGAALTENI